MNSTINRLKIFRFNTITRSSRWHLLCVAVLLSLPAYSSATKQTTGLSSLADITQRNITIYNQHLAFIQELRKIPLSQGEQTIRLSGVSGKIQPETLLLTPMSPDLDLKILEQNYDQASLSSDTLLREHLGKEISLRSFHPLSNKAILRTGKLLSVDRGVVIQFDDGIEVNPTGQYVFKNLPTGLKPDSSLSVTLDNFSSNIHDATMELSYLSAGFSWKADYVAKLNRAKNALDLKAWITLSNYSGKPFTDSNVTVIAGDINKVAAPRDFRAKTAALMEASAAADGISSSSIMEYHAYQLDRKVSLQDQQTKQLALFSAENIPVEKQLIFNSAGNYYHYRVAQVATQIKPDIILSIQNEEGSGLGRPFPKGIIRVYGPADDRNSNNLFMGEDLIEHSPKNQTLAMTVGKAFDISMDKTQISFESHKRIGSKNSFTSSYTLDIKNSKDTDEKVIVRETIPGDWTVTSSNMPYKKISAQQIEWELTVSADSLTTINYTVSTHY